MMTAPSDKSLNANEDNQNKLIFKALIKYKQPLTGRCISEETGLETTILCLALSNLVNQRKLLKVVCKPCEKTKRKVNHFHFVDGLKLGGLTQW